MATETEIDARGLLCPLPVLRLRKAAARHAPGAVLRLLADDPAAAIDVPHYCAEGGHAFLGAEPLAEPPAAPGKRPAAYRLRLGG